MATQPADNSGLGTAPTDQSADEEFGAALAELTGATTPADDAAAGKPDEAGESADKRPAPADQAADSHTADGSEASPDGKQPQDDIWANATPEQRKALDDLKRDNELRVKSVAGRLSAADRELARLRSLSGQQPQQGQDEQHRSGQGAQDDDSQNAGKAKKAALEQLREDYPDLAEPILQEMAEMRTELSTLKEGYGEFRQTQTQATISAQEAVLAEKHPDWQQVAQDERFMGWLESQPTSIKEAMNRNFNAIVDGADAALVVGMFKSDMGIETAAPTPTPSPSPTPRPDEKRQKQLHAGRESGGNGPAAATGVSNDDFDGALTAAIRERDKARTD